MIIDFSLNSYGSKCTVAQLIINTLYTGPLAVKPLRRRARSQLPLPPFSFSPYSLLLSLRREKSALDQLQAHALRRRGEELCDQPPALRVRRELRAPIFRQGLASA